MKRTRPLISSPSWLAGLASSVGLAALISSTSFFSFTAFAEPPAAAQNGAPSGMNDSEWKKNSGTGTVPERYQVVKGDTLWGISKRFFGDAAAWPKLYESNKENISNPNLIYPGKWVIFVPGTGTSLPKLTDQDPAKSSIDKAAGAPTASSDKNSDQAEVAAAAEDTLSSGSSKSRSQEWKMLPKQSWEVTPTALPPNVDSLGFEKDNKLRFSKEHGFELDAISATERVTSLGQIVGARSGGEYLTLGDTVYIRADEDIQMGETYAITQEPAVLKSRKSDRQGYSYLILGKVKIIGVRDDLFIGTITGGRDFIYRGNELIPNPPKVPVLQPVAAPLAVEGILMLDKHLSSFYAAQHKLVFIDRGSADGVKLGNIFRAYEHYDLSNEKKITSSDFIIDADAMVVQVSDHFSVATVIHSIVPVTENSTAVLLTDVSDLTSNKGFRGSNPGEKSNHDELDDLDKLDGSGLGKDEQKELQQLEKWKGNPPSANGQPPAPGAPGAPPTSEETTAPPPPPPPPPSDTKVDELAPPPPLESGAPALPTDAGALPPPAAIAPPPPPPAPADGPVSLPPPSTPDPAPQSAKKSSAVKAPAAPGEPPPPPPPAPGGGASAPPVDESKALDQLLNQ